MSPQRRLDRLELRNDTPDGVTSEEWDTIVAQRNRYALRFLTFVLCFAVVLLAVLLHG